MKRLWFKAKNYGYGWYPCSWEGWLVTVVYFLILLVIFRLIDIQNHSVSDSLISMIIPFVILTCLLVLICIRTGEKARWNWGKDKQKT